MTWLAGGLAGVGVRAYRLVCISRWFGAAARAYRLVVVKAYPWRFFVFRQIR